MNPTRPQVLAGVFLVVGVLAYLLMRSTYDSLPRLPWGPVLTVAALAVLEVVSACTTRNRLRGKNLAKPIHPLGVARLAALAKASSLLGAALAGAWTGALIYLLGLSGAGNTISDDRGVSIAGLVSGIVLVAAALWLEWVCRVKRPPTATGSGDRSAPAGPEH